MVRFVFYALCFLAFSVSVFAGPCSFRMSYFVGESMVPAIYPGDDVFVRWLGPGERPSRGDIVVARYKDTSFDINLLRGSERPTWLVHRLYAVSKVGYVFKGDNNALPDPVVFGKRSVVGVVCRVVHK